MINIALIGAGQLGSRHLQALANSKHELNIQVVDTSEESLKTAQSRFNEVASGFNGKVSFVTSVEQLNKKLEIVIVATNSKVRRAIIEQVIHHTTVKYFILEKFLFTTEADFDAVENLLLENNIKAWVNCTRRMMTGYKNLRHQLLGSTSVNFSVAGNAWGLGCNGIHMLDLFSFLIQSTNISLDNILLDPIIYESKRAGYVEFTGTIRGVSEKHSLSMTSFSNNTSPLIIHIDTPTARYRIQEGTESTVWANTLENNWKLDTYTFNIPFQSQLTNVVVDELLDSGDCELTTYNESAVLHKLFLKNILQFVQQVKNDKTIKECLIT